jgi:hypothetical protein
MKFNLRDLFWLIAVIALACGWLIDHRRQYAVYLKDQKFWNESTSISLRGYSRMKAENDALKAASKQQIAQP